MIYNWLMFPKMSKTHIQDEWCRKPQNFTKTLDLRPVTGQCSATFSLRVFTADHRRELFQVAFPSAEGKKCNMQLTSACCSLPSSLLQHVTTHVTKNVDLFITGRIPASTMLSKDVVLAPPSSSHPSFQPVLRRWGQCSCPGPWSPFAHRSLSAHSCQAPSAAKGESPAAPGEAETRTPSRPTTTRPRGGWFNAGDSKRAQLLIAWRRGPQPTRPKRGDAQRTVLGGGVPDPKVSS